jgi:hypothetical protein
MGIILYSLNPQIGDVDAFSHSQSPAAVELCSGTGFGLWCGFERGVRVCGWPTGWGGCCRMKFVGFRTFPRVLSTVLAVASTSFQKEFWTRY